MAGRGLLTLTRQTHPIHRRSANFSSGHPPRKEGSAPRAFSPRYAVEGELGREVFNALALIILVLLLAALPVTIMAQASEPTATGEPAVAATILTLNGTVTHNSGGAVPADLLVTLRIINPQRAETDIETTADAAGAFSFPDIAIFPDHFYVATVEVQGDQFASALLPGSQLSESNADLSITLYDFTDDPSVLAVNALQAQAVISLNEMQVLELYRFTNSGNAAYRAADGSSVRVNIPENATLVDMGSARFAASADGRQLIDTAPVLPGDAHTLHVLYTLPYGGAATVSHIVDYPLLNGFQVLIDTPGLTVSGDDIEPLGGGSGGMAFGVPASMPAGATVSYTISGIPAAVATAIPAAPAVQTGALAATTTAPDVPSLSVILMILGGACIGIAAVLFIRERRQSAAVRVEAAADPRVNALVQQIAELDVAFQAGTLSKEAYETQRNALKTQLLTFARGDAEK